MSKIKQAKVKIKMFRSPLLGRKVNYCAILPDLYQKSSAKFPVLYLLHGLFGRSDNWLTNTKIIEYAANLPYIIICLDGGDSWYSDSPNLTNHFYESYIFEELLPDVELNFAVRAERSARAIAGLSMGGYGAFKFAFRRPEMFCFTGSMSGAFHAAELFEDEADTTWRELYPSISEVFGNKQGHVRTANDLTGIVENFSLDKVSGLPFFYFDCGLKDSFLTVNRNLSKLFQRLGIRHEFRELAGGHDWIYWNRNLNYLLQLCSLRLST